MNHEQVQERSSSTAARTKSRSGQKRGVAYFSKTELSALLVLIEEHKPCGAFQWDIVSTAMYNAGHKNRYRDAYKKKFDKLWQTNEPTGSMEMPSDIMRAKEIKDMISSHEVIGYASHNRNDGSDGLTGTNLVNKDGTMKQPGTHRRKKSKIMEKLDGTCESISESNREVVNVLGRIAKVLENENFNIGNCEDLVKSSELNEFKAQLNECKAELNEFEVEVKSQFNILKSTLSALISKSD